MKNINSTARVGIGNNKANNKRNLAVTVMIAAYFLGGIGVGVLIGFIYQRL